MDLDKILMIPYLSKELNLIGYQQLPYKIKRTKKTKPCLNEDFAVEEKDFSSDDESPNPCNSKVVFENNQMISSLVSVCFDLVKQVKSLNSFSDVYVPDKLIYDNRQQKAQLETLTKKLKQKEDKLSAERVKYEQISHKLGQLQIKVKSIEEEKKKIHYQCKTNEGLLQNQIKKKSNDLFHLHKTLQNRYDMVDLRYMPKNFEVLYTDQPNFTKLWSDVKYSSAPTREASLKKAVCTLQANNQSLMEDNITLKSVLFSTLQEMDEIVHSLMQNVHLKVEGVSENELTQVLISVKGSELAEWRKYLNKKIFFLRNLLNAVEEASFVIENDVFVNWTDVIKGIALMQLQEMNLNAVKRKICPENKYADCETDAILCTEDTSELQISDLESEQTSYVN